ncbi:MAG: SH3 domain-containing protein [Rhodobacter sp.]|nr:SH3 domain-containing protein [Rhodobacter sp.]
MIHSKSLKLVLAGVAAFILSAPAAPATEAQATTALNVRSGPGTSYAIVDTLTPGEIVDATECQPNGWCYITHSGPDGWVSGSYLTAAPSAGTPEPDCGFRLTIGPGGKPRFTLVCGDADVTVPFPGTGPTPPTHGACFYDGPNYTGASFCRAPGTYNSLPAAANDRITSIQLYGNGKVQLCENQNLGSFCRNVTSNVPQLGAFLNNKVSSMRVVTGLLPLVKQVCFFDRLNWNTNFAYFCRRPGGPIAPLPPGANNRIESVWPFGGARAVLCDSPTYGLGPCINVTTKTNLAPLVRNRASSLRVFP